MVEAKLLCQTLASHGVLFLAAPPEEGKLLGAQSEGAGSPSVSGGVFRGGLSGHRVTPGPHPHRGLACHFSGTAAIAPIIAAVKDGKSVTYEGREVGAVPAATSRAWTLDSRCLGWPHLEGSEQLGFHH